MLEFFSTNNTSTLLLLALAVIAVFYILTDGSKSSQDKKDYTDETRKTEEKEKDTAPIETKVEEPKKEVQSVERKQTANQTTINSNVAEQTMNYQPTSTAPLPRIKSVTTTTVYEDSHPVQPEQPVQPVKEEIHGNLTLDDFTPDEEEIDVVCQWCDNVVKMRKGSSIVCPRCSGTIES